MERLAHFVRSQESGLWRPHRKDRADQGGRSTSGRLSTQTAPLLRRSPSSDWLRPIQDKAPLGEPGLQRTKVSPPEPPHGPLVGTACLETEALPLHRQIVEFSRRAQSAGAQRVCLVPLFLLAGVHVMDDIPAEVEQARQGLPGLALEVCPHLGSHPGLRGLLRQKLQATTIKTPILLAHGSRRPGGNEPIHALAQSLGGSAAFWSVAPSLEDQVIHHMQSGVQRIAILPYFLFAGSTTDAITHLTEDLAERFSQLTFHLLPPLGPSPELARLVIDLALDRVPARSQQPPIPMQRLAFRHGISPSSLVS